MSEIIKEQTCPHCGFTEEDAHSEWEDGTHVVNCGCGKPYHVETVYTFEGWKTQKICEGCGQPEDECYCDVDNNEVNT